MICGGVEALAARPNLGRRPRLTDEERAELARIVRDGPRTAGFATDLRTLRRVAKVIRERFGAAYHVRYLGRLLKKLGFTRQKPAFRATQRDERAIARWRSHDWPRIKKRLVGAERRSFSSTKPAFCSAL